VAAAEVIARVVNGGLQELGMLLAFENFLGVQIKK